MADFRHMNVASLDQGAELPPLEEIEYQRGAYLRSLELISEISDLDKLGQNKNLTFSEALDRRGLNPVIHPRLLRQDRSLIPSQNLQN